MESCWQKLLSVVVFSSARSSFLGTARNGLVTRLRKEHYCLNCMRLQLSEVFTEKSNSTFSKRVPLTDYRSRFQDVDSIKFQRRYTTDSGTFSHRNKWDDKAQDFVESENDYFHSYLESVPEYQPYFLASLSRREAYILPDETVAKLLQEVKEEKKAENLLLLMDHWSAIASIEGWHVLSDDSFSQTARLLKKNTNQFSMEEIIKIMANLNSLGFRQSLLSFAEPRKNRILVSKAFDQVCSKRVKKFAARELLLAADFFYSVRGSSFTDFPYLMLERMKFFLPTLTKAELILLLFHISMARKTSSNLIDAALDCLKQDFNSLTIQELGIINLAHYKTRSHINQPAYFTALTKHLETDVGRNIDPICLSAVLKYQQKSLNKCRDQFVPQFFTTVKHLEDPLRPRISTLPSETLMHVLNLYYSLDLLSEDLFVAVIDRVLHRGVQDWRVKDLAKVTHILTNTPLSSEKKMEALAAILVELQRAQRQGERHVHPGCMLQIAVALTYCNVYPHWLVEEVFGDLTQKAFQDSEIDYRRDLYHLSESISIEDITYTGPLLWASNFPKLAKNRVYRKVIKARGGKKTVKQSDSKMSSSYGLFTRDWILLDLMDALSKARPEVTPTPTFLLPHFQSPDVEIRLRCNCQSKDDASLSNPHCIDTDWLVGEAVVLHAGNAYQRVRCSDGNTVPLLRQYHAMRARQLRKLGATVIEVPYFEFQDCDDKSQYLLTKFKEEEKRQCGTDHV